MGSVTQVSRGLVTATATAAIALAALLTAPAAQADPGPAETAARPLADDHAPEPVAGERLAQRH
jgi:hypothetical protein